MDLFFVTVICDCGEGHELAYLLTRQEILSLSIYEVLAIDTIEVFATEKMIQNW